MNFGAQLPQLTFAEQAAHGVLGSRAKMAYQQGYNANITGANRETVWNTGGPHTPIAAEADFDVVSDNAADDAGSTGVTSVRITYLDSDYVEHYEVVTMNADTPVTTDATDIYRIQDFRAETVGTGKVAAGKITIKTKTSGAVTYATIDAGETRSKQMIYSVPAGYDLQMSAFAWASSGDAGKAYMRYTLFANYNDITNAVNGIFYPLMEVSVAASGIVYTMPTPLVLPEKTDMYMSVIGDAQTLTAISTASWRGVLSSNA